jgi:hypothetical protein
MFALMALKQMPYGKWQGEQDWAFANPLGNRLEKLLELVNTRTAQFVNWMTCDRLQDTCYGLSHILYIDGL